MFYSHLLLSKKGALGIIWMAAHCYKRIKKDQIQQTNISASVDKILDDEVPVVTHRILAFLLLGVVRIYSKKVDFLYDDCHDVLNKLISFKTQKSKHAGSGVPQKHYHLITLPRSFELDAFDLELFQDQNLECGNVSSPEQVLQAEVLEKDCNTHGYIFKEHTAYTPPRDVFSPHYRGRDLLADPFIKMKMSLAGPEILHGTNFSLDDRMDPMVLDEIEEKQMHNKISKDDPQASFSGATKEFDPLSVVSLSNSTNPLPPSLEILRGTGFPLEDHSDHLVLAESEKDRANEMPSDDNMRTDFQGLIEDVALNFVTSPFSQGSDFVGSLGILNKSGKSIEHSPGFKMSNDAAKEQIRDKPSLKEHEVAGEHTDIRYRMDRMDQMVLDEIEEKQMHNKISKDDSQASFSGATKEFDPLSVVSLSNSTSPLPPSLEILRGTGFSLEDHSDQLVLAESEKDRANEMPSDDNMRTDFQGLIEDVALNFVTSPFSQGSDFVGSLGILNKSGKSIEHSPGFKMSNDAAKEQIRDKPSLKEHKVAGEHTEHLRTQLSFQEDGHEVIESVNKAQLVAVSKRKFLEVITPESLKCQRMNEFLPSIGISDSILPELNSPKVANVQTPATRERAKILKKREILLDLLTILPNKVIKSWIELNPSDLKRQRRKVPITASQAWRAGKLGHAPHRFIESLLSGISIQLSSLQYEKSCAAAIAAVEVSASQNNIQSPVTHGVSELDILSPVTERFPEQMPIAPATPVTHLIPLRSHEMGAIADSDILEPSTSRESEENWSSSEGGLELDAEFFKETNLCDGDRLENYAHSVRTRMLGRYLHRKIMAKRRKNKGEVLNMSQLLKGKTRKEIARLFYEILVLKSQDCINVQQENAYCDILLSENSKLKLAIEC